MTDFFAVFGLPHRPGLDEAALKEKYFQQAAQLHPDASAGDTEKFRTLQEAFQTLFEPSSRLRHLQELDFPAASPASMQGDLFMQVGQAVQNAQSILQRLEKTQTPLARALLLGEIASALEGVRTALQAVEASCASLMENLSQLDAAWPPSDGAELNRLASGLSFVTRWQAQLSEWEFRLTHN